MMTPFLKENLQQDTLQQSKTDSNAFKLAIKYSQKNTINQQTLSSKPLETKKDSLVKPEFYSIDLNNNSLIDNYKTYKWLNTNIDSNCYITNKQIVTPKKILQIKEETIKTKNFKSDYIIKEKLDTSYDWVFVPALLGLGLLAVIATYYRKYFALLFESIFYRYSNNKILNEKNSSFQKLSIILDILYVISFSLAIDQIIKGFGIFSPPSNLKYIVFIAFVGLLIILKLFRFLIFKMITLFSKSKEFLSDLFNTSALYTRILGLILVPLAFIIAYSTGTLNTISLYTSIFIIVIMLILRTISMFRSFILGGISIFYFILYLCALEIVPLLIIVKELKSR